MSSIFKNRCLTMDSVLKLVDDWLAIHDIKIAVDDDTIGNISVNRRLNMQNQKSLKAFVSAIKRCSDDANALREKYHGNAIK